MATFFKRKLKKLMATDHTPPSLTIPTPEGGVTLSKAEVSRYGLLHTMLASDMSGEIGGTEGAAFLMRSGLDRAALQTVWKNASGGTKSKAKLTREDFFLACKLVAYAQANPGQPIALAAIADGNRPAGGAGTGLADFHYGVVPDDSLGGAEAGAAAEFPEASIKVTVGNPQTFGSGLDKHTRYQVITNTSLAHFPRKQIEVWRCVRAAGRPARARRQRRGARPSHPTPSPPAPSAPQPLLRL